MPVPLPETFFSRSALEVARHLLGALLVYEHPLDGLLVGRIVETEAYTQDDPAFRGWRVFDEAAGLVLPAGRALDLFGRPGRAYVYRCYASWLLNVVTEPEGHAGCVLIRAVEPLVGQAAMSQRRPAARRPEALANGPGKLCQAFGLDGRAHLLPLTTSPFYMAVGDGLPESAVARSARIGLSFGVDRPYRFYAAGHPCVSPGVPSDVAASRRRGRRDGQPGGRRLH